MEPVRASRSWIKGAIRTVSAEEWSEREEVPSRYQREAKQRNRKGLECMTGVENIIFSPLAIHMEDTNPWFTRRLIMIEWLHHHDEISADKTMTMQSHWIEVTVSRLGSVRVHVRVF